MPYLAWVKRMKCGGIVDGLLKEQPLPHTNGTTRQHPPTIPKRYSISDKRDNGLF